MSYGVSAAPSLAPFLNRLTNWGRDTPPGARDGSDTAVGPHDPDRAFQTTILSTMAPIDLAGRYVPRNELFAHQPGEPFNRHGVAFVFFGALGVASSKRRREAGLA